MDNDASIQCNQALRGSQQWVDVQFFDPWLLADQVAEADHNLLQQVQVDRWPAAHTFQGGVDLGALHHATSQCRVEGRQRQGAVFENLNQLAAQAEQQHRAELWIEAAAKDQLVAIQADHRLDGDAKEVDFAVLVLLTAHLGQDGSLDALIGFANTFGIFQVQLHAADVGLVGNNFRMQLKNNWIADLLSRRDCVFFAGRDDCIHCRDMVSRQQFL